MDHEFDDKQLEALLKQRRVPEMRSNLAYRIIEASRDVPQEKEGMDRLFAGCKQAGSEFLKGVASVLDHVALPQPAFAMVIAVVMIGGAMLGASADSLSSAAWLSNNGYTSSDDSSDVEAYIMATDSFEYGDFL